MYLCKCFFFSVTRIPPPSECDLYYVNRDTLFSYHKESELFLQVVTYFIYLKFNVLIISYQHISGIYILTLAAYDGPLCCFSLQKLSKRFTINGGCSSPPLVCVTWYTCFPVDGFYCIFHMIWTSTDSWYLGPVDESKNQLPDILCVIQVCIYHQYWHPRIISPSFNAFLLQYYFGSSYTLVFGTFPTYIIPVKFICVRFLIR